MSYIRNHVTSRHKIWVEMDGVMYQMPGRTRMTLLPDPDGGLTAHPAPDRTGTFTGMELKLVRFLLRRALASIDARENHKQRKASQLNDGLTVKERHRKEKQADMARLRDELYEREPERFERAPRGYKQRLAQRMVAQ